MTWISQACGSCGNCCSFVIIAANVPGTCWHKEPRQVTTATWSTRHAQWMIITCLLCFMSRVHSVSAGPPYATSFALSASHPEGQLGSGLTGVTTVGHAVPRDVDNY